VRYAKTVIVTLLVILLTACAGFNKLSNTDKLKVVCDDTLTQYEQLYSKSLAITQNPNTTTETRKYVITQINPLLNQVKPMILQYCEGTLASKDQIIVIIGNIITLYGGVPK
jgi:hypothetical protein